MKSQPLNIFQPKRFHTEFYQASIQQKQNLRFFVTTSHGFEKATLEEIQKIIFLLQADAKAWEGSGGCYVEGPWYIGIGLNLSLMTASRVLLIIGEADIQNEQELYAFAHQLQWPSFFDVNSTFAVSSNVKNSFLTNNMYASLCIKDALCDAFRKAIGKRPTVDTALPQVKVFVRLNQNQLSIALDTTGIPLSQRGYRQRTIEAPLKETIAASILRTSGWCKLSESIWNSPQPVYFDRYQTDDLKEKPTKIPKNVLLTPFLQDPMCGSGSFSIEAALAFLHWHPNARRESFAFQYLFPELENDIHSAWRNVKMKIIAQEKSLTDVSDCIQAYVQANELKIDANIFPSIRASDINIKSLHVAQECAHHAGVGKMISFHEGDVFHSRPHASHGMVIINPPYGERMSATNTELVDMYAHFGDLWKQKFPHWCAWIVSSNRDALKALSLRPTRKMQIFNGNLECQLLQYVLYPKENNLPNKII